LQGSAFKLISARAWARAGGTTARRLLHVTAGKAAFTGGPA
jgi:hypothetical protein